jgi:hypothetical protein
MLSEKIKQYLIEKKIYDETEDMNYQNVITNLGISQDSAFADFNLHTNSVTFSGRMFEIYNVCWFSINSHYQLDINWTHNILKLPEEYIPLDSFEAEGGVFYNRKTGEVLELELGQKLNDFHNGKLFPQWKDFNLFLEWYFEL